MQNTLFNEFAPIIQSMSRNDLEGEIQQPSRLLLDSASVGTKRLDVAYAPFDFVNPHARIVIVGLTPGRQQMRNGLQEVQRLLHEGVSLEETARAAKVFASFSGPMRTNLVQMLDSIGVSNFLGLNTAASLWNGDARFVHFTSALRYPVFVNGANYSGSPDMLKTPLLASQLKRWLASEMAALPGALFVPLGPKVGDALRAVAVENGISQAQVLVGLPHPSGANAERIAYFLGRKTRAALSTKTNAVSLDRARDRLRNQISELEG